MAGTNINMYKATITNKKISQGKLTVDVLFFDESDSFSERFETTQSQDKPWIGEHITQRLNHLNSLPPLGETIVLGDVDTTPREPTEEEVYREKATAYAKYMDIARQGLIQPDRPIILELRKWLRENFKDDYLKLF